MTHHTTNVNGIQMHYVEAGQGPPVFLLHGFPETSFAWRKQIPALSRRFRVIVPDLRGYGYTEKPPAGYDKRTMARDIFELMRLLGYEKIVLVGHDRGARVATRFAKDYPGALDRLVILDNIPTRIVFNRMDAEIARGHWFFIFNNVPDLPEALITGREELWLRFIFAQWCYNPEVFSPSELAEYVRAYSQPGALRGAFNDYRACREDVAQDEADAATLIACPTLVVWGENFKLNPPLFDVMEVWRGMAKDVRGISIPQCGHLPHEEQPALVNREILNFLGAEKFQEACLTEFR